jgi:asparagine synthase (glutamine-hydrolysing)
LEVRVPLLDHRLVEEVVRWPGTWRQAIPSTKPLLLGGTGSRLPRVVWNRAKRGFTFPWQSWLRGALAPRAQEAAHDQEVWRNLGFDPAAPVSTCEAFSRGDPRVSPLQVLALIVLADFTRRHRLRRAA